MKALVVAKLDQKLSIDDAKSKLKLLCGGQTVTEIIVYRFKLSWVQVVEEQETTFFYLHSNLFVDKIRVKKT